jgi:hypothetical protein
MRGVLVMFVYSSPQRSLQPECGASFTSSEVCIGQERESSITARSFLVFFFFFGVSGVSRSFVYAPKTYLVNCLFSLFYKSKARVHVLLKKSIQHQIAASFYDTCQ